MKLQQQLAWVIGTLIFAPNALLVFMLWRANRDASILAGSVGWILLIAAISTIAGVVLSRTILRPIDDLTEGLAMMKRSDRPLSDLTLPKPGERPPKEIQNLRDNFEDMLSRIKELLESREATYAALTHDLKTPLLAGIRMLDLLEANPDYDEAKRKEYVVLVREELARSYEMIENLLTMSRIETQPISFESINVRSVLEDMHLRYRVAAKRKGILLSISGSGYVTANRVLLDRALSNLIENAIRHAKGTVTLVGGENFTEVQDDGPGLSEPLERLILPFRSQMLRGFRAGSAGLGLFVAQRVAELHGGSLQDLSGSKPGDGKRLTRLRISTNPAKISSGKLTT